MESENPFQIGLETWILIVRRVLHHARDLDIEQIDGHILALYLFAAVVDARKPGIVRA